MIRCLQPLLYGTRIVVVSPSEAITCVQEKITGWQNFYCENISFQSWIFTCYVLRCFMTLQLLSAKAAFYVCNCYKKCFFQMVFLETRDMKKNSGVHNYAWISHVVICYCIFAYKITQNQLCSMKATRKKLSEHDFKSLQCSEPFFKRRVKWPFIKGLGKVVNSKLRTKVIASKHAKNRSFSTHAVK